MVTACFQVRRAGHDGRLNVSEKSSDVGVDAHVCTRSIGLSESCSVSAEACGADSTSEASIRECCAG